MDLLYAVQHTVWPGAGMDLLDAAARADWRRHLTVLVGAGLLTGVGQFLLGRLSGTGIDVTSAIWLHAGRLPRLRTLGSAVLSIVVVGMGASLGREGAPKQAGAVIANTASDAARLSDETRRLLVACGAGAGFAAAYGVPLGGALFALEVVRRDLAPRFVLPALITSVIATGVSWLFLPDAPTYQIPAYTSSLSAVVWALPAGLVAGVFAVRFVRAVAWADGHRPQGWSRLAAPLLCLSSGTPGGLFTPSLAAGALLGGVLGHAWTLFWPGVPPGLFALIGAAAFVAATTQGPVSTVVLMVELTGHIRSFILPLLLAVTIATLTARLIDARSIYDARLTGEELRRRDLALPES